MWELTAKNELLNVIILYLPWNYMHPQYHEIICVRCIKWAIEIIIHKFYFQIACCNAIRNIVSRSKQYVQEFVSLDIEDLLNSVRRTYPQSDASVKAALRDLGLKVELKEEWKGTGVKVSNDSTSTIKDIPEEVWRDQSNTLYIEHLYVPFYFS